MDRKSIIEELTSIDEEGSFLKKLIKMIEDLSEKGLKIVLEEGIESLGKVIFP